MINSVHSGTVHADAINWDKQNVETEAVNGNSNANQSTNNVKVSNVQSTKQNYVVKLQTSNVQAGQINKTKIAQFNSNSKIYGLNNSNELSKNNGDGYVITNAGTFNGKSVDIGVTINNVQNNQGTYTTKWSNGDKASQTGKVDNQFNYQNSVTVNSNTMQPVTPDQTRIRTENQQVNESLSGLWVVQSFENYIGGDGTTRYAGHTSVIDPTLIANIMSKTNFSEDKAVSLIVGPISYYTKDDNSLTGISKNITYEDISNEIVHQKLDDGSDKYYIDKYYFGKSLGQVNLGNQNDGSPEDRTIVYHLVFTDKMTDADKYLNKADSDCPNLYTLGWNVKSMNPEPYEEHDPRNYADTNDDLNIITAGNKFDPCVGFYNDDATGTIQLTNDLNKIQTYAQTGKWTWPCADATSKYADNSIQDFNPWTKMNSDDNYKNNGQIDVTKYMTDKSLISANVIKPTNVTDHLQIDQVKNGNLNYDYTIGLYDHDTGNLITSLKPEYKDGVKVGKTATTADTVMNNAIKNKIADIRNNKAAVAFNGTAANDNVAFYQETTPVQDISKLTATASRTITLHFPNNQRPASYDSLVNSNNQIVQTLKFTRTGTTDLVTGQTIYMPWQGDSEFPAVNLPSIPGFKLQIS